MPDHDHEFQKRYEKLMGNAGERKRMLAQQALANERRIRQDKVQRANAMVARERMQSLKEIARRRAAELARVEVEIEKLQAGLIGSGLTEERIWKATQGSHRYALLAILKATKFKRRKPPESGVAVPAVPPRGPLPKQGGAEAPLDFSD